MTGHADLIEEGWKMKALLRQLEWIEHVGEYGASYWECSICLADDIDMPWADDTNREKPVHRYNCELARVLGSPTERPPEVTVSNPRNFDEEG